MSKTKVGILVGSLRKESFSRKIAKNLAAMFPDTYEVVFIEIDELPLYNQDFDDIGPAPKTYAPYRQLIGEQDAILFVTPEYNRSVPAVLKNALDVASRPFGQNKWDKKPAAIVSVSPGNLSAFGANHHLRQSLVFLNMPTMAQPEAYIGNATAFLDEAGKITNPDTEKFFQSIIDAFVAWINQQTK